MDQKVLACVNDFHKHDGIHIDPIWSLPVKSGSLFLVHLLKNMLQIARCVTYKHFKITWLRSSTQRYGKSTEYVTSFRSSQQRCSIKEGVLKNFAKLTGKDLCQSRFLIKLKSSACDLTKRNSGTYVFQWVLQNLSFSQEHLPTIASVFLFEKYLNIFWR